MSSRSTGGASASPGGPRAAWERRAEAAELKAVALRLPALPDTKPLLLAAQLDPAVRRLGQGAWEGTAAQGAAVRAAARHLGGLAARLDASPDATACLTFWGLLLRAEAWLDGRPGDAASLHPGETAVHHGAGQPP